MTLHVEAVSRVAGTNKHLRSLMAGVHRAENSLRQAATAVDDGTRMLQSKVEGLESTNLVRLSEIRQREMEKGRVAPRCLTSIETDSRGNLGWDIRQIKVSACDSRVSNMSILGKSGRPKH